MKVSDLFASLHAAGLSEVMLYLPDGNASRCHWRDTTTINETLVALLGDQDRGIVRIVPVDSCTGIGIPSPKGVDPNGYKAMVLSKIQSMEEAGAGTEDEEKAMAAAGVGAEGDYDDGEYDDSEYEDGEYEDGEYEEDEEYEEAEAGSGSIAVSGPTAGAAPIPGSGPAPAPAPSPAPAGGMGAGSAAASGGRGAGFSGSVAGSGSLSSYIETPARPGGASAFGLTEAAPGLTEFVPEDSERPQLGRPNPPRGPLIQRPPLGRNNPPGTR